MNGTNPKAPLRGIPLLRNTGSSSRCGGCTGSSSSSDGVGYSTKRLNKTGSTNTNGATGIEFPVFFPILVVAVAVVVVPVVSAVVMVLV